MKRKKLNFMEYAEDLDRLADNLNRTFGKPKTYDELIDNLEVYFEGEKTTDFIKQLESNPEFKKELIERVIDKRVNIDEKELRQDITEDEDYTKKIRKSRPKVSRKFMFRGVVNGKSVKAYITVFKNKNGKIITRLRDKKGRFVKKSR